MTTPQLKFGGGHLLFRRCGGGLIWDCDCCKTCDEQKVCATGDNCSGPGAYLDGFPTNGFCCYPCLSTISVTIGSVTPLTGTGYDEVLADFATNGTGSQSLVSGAISWIWNKLGLVSQISGSTVYGWQIVYTSLDRDGSTGMGIPVRDGVTEASVVISIIQATCTGAQVGDPMPCDFTNVVDIASITSWQGDCCGPTDDGTITLDPTYFSDSTTTITKPTIAPCSACNLVGLLASVPSSVSTADALTSTACAGSPVTITLTAPLGSFTDKVRYQGSGSGTTTFGGEPCTYNWTFNVEYSGAGIDGGPVCHWVADFFLTVFNNDPDSPDYGMIVYTCGNTGIKYCPAGCTSPTGAYGFSGVTYFNVS